MELLAGFSVQVCGVGFQKDAILTKPFWSIGLISMANNATPEGELYRFVFREWNTCPKKCILHEHANIHI